MVATLPATSAFLTGHKLSTTEWAQILNVTLALSNIKTQNVIGGMVYSSTSASYSNISGASLTGFSKQLDSSSSDVLLIMGCGSRSGTAGTNITFALNDGTTDWQTTVFRHNTAAKHSYALGITKATGLAVATYTFQARAKSNGTATMTIDGNDCALIIAIELPK